MSSDLTVLAHEPMGVVIPVPEGWNVQATEDGTALAAVGGDDLGNDLLNPSVTVERKAWSSDFAEVKKLAESSLAEMRETYADFDLLWSRDDADTSRVTRAYSYTHEQLGAVTQAQALVGLDHLVVVTCTAPRETYGKLAGTFERIVSTVDALNPDDLVEDPDDD